MKTKNCLQYCINSMNDQIFQFANTNQGKELITVLKQWSNSSEGRIKELMLHYTSYFMVQASIEVIGMPKTEKSVAQFMGSKAYDKLYKELFKTIYANYPMLVSRFNPDQRQRLRALFA